MDPKKITKGFYTDELSEGKDKRRIPIIHFSQATPPIIICVKLVCIHAFYLHESTLDSFRV